MAVLHLDAQAPVVALVGGTVINPGPAAGRSVSTILIEGGRITQVGPEMQVKVPSGAQAIDARGKFIIPGLIDTHHHLGSGLFGATQPDPAKNLAELLSWGVTSVFNTGTSAQIFSTLKAATKAHDAPYPRFYSSGRIFGAKGGWAADYAPATPDEARVNVREAKAAGVDAIKLVYDDMSWLRKEPLVMMPADVLRAIVEEAHTQGLRAYVHAPILRFAKEALRAGADGFVHGVLSDPVDAEFIELMKKNRAFYSGTHTLFEACGDLAGWSRRLQAFDDRGRIPAAAYEALRAPDAIARWEKSWTNTAYTKEKLPVLRANLKRLSDAGVAIAAGTDTGVPGVVLGSRVADRAAAPRRERPIYRRNTAGGHHHGSRDDWRRQRARAHRARTPRRPRRPRCRPARRHRQRAADLPRDEGGHRPLIRPVRSRQSETGDRDRLAFLGLLQYRL